MKTKYLILNLVLIIFVVGVGLTYFIVNSQELKFSKQSLNSQSLILENYLTSSTKKIILPIQEASIIFVGDVMLSRMVDQKMREHKDYYYPFLQVRDYLKSADAVFGNLETAITPGRNISTGEMYFRADPQVAQVLNELNFKVLSLANNHTPNFGQSGLLNTFEYLQQANIKYVGAGNDDTEAYAPVYFEAKEIRFAFLAYTYNATPVDYQASFNHAGTAFMNLEKMVEAVKQAKKNADVIIISLHAGEEYTSSPNQQQIEFAHQAIDAGADLVIGHHPHWVQSAEIYQGKYIFYSLGNFVFDQMWSQKTKEGLALKITFTKEGVKNFKPQAIIIQDYAQPQLLFDEDGKTIIERLKL